MRPLESDADDRRARLLGHEHIDVVLDVGANVGQYAMRLRHNGFEGRIVSFEPYAQAFAELARTASHDPFWEVRRLALSDQDGQAELNVSGNSFSSSLLALTDRHLQSAPRSAYIAAEVVQTARLDTLWPELVGSARAWLKLDVQGFEMHVLRGAGEMLRDARAIQVELSVEALYDGAPVWTTVIDWLLERGFQLAALEPGFDDPATGMMLQFDGTFLRRG